MKKLMTIYLKLTWSIPFYTQQSKSAAIKQTLVQSEIVSTFFITESYITLKWIAESIQPTSQWNFFPYKLVFALVRFLSSTTPLPWLPLKREGSERDRKRPKTSENQTTTPSMFSNSPSTSSSFCFFWTALLSSTFSLLTEKKLSIDLENVFARFNLPSWGSVVSRPLMVNQVNTLAN